MLFYNRCCSTITEKTFVSGVCSMYVKTTKRCGKHDCYHTDTDGQCLLSIEDIDGCQCYEPWLPWEDIVYE